jgi:ribosomal-protein-alanine N-acetyltransferase
MSDLFETSAPEMKTDRLSLVPLAAEDCADIFAYASDPEVAKYTLWPPHKSAEFTARFVSLFRQPSFLSWSVREVGSSTAIGMVFLHSYNKVHKRAEIGFNLPKAYWNRGLTSEAAPKVISFAFTELKLHRVEATCMPANTFARRALEKISFRYEGSMRQSHMRYDGPKDMELFGILSSDIRDGLV